MIWRRVLLALLLIYALSAVVRVTTNTLDSRGAVDFYTYWYDGVLARLGINTFTRYQNQAIPEATLSFVGVGEQPIPAVRFPLPANPPLGIILFTGLAFFQWESAKVLWLILNGLCALLVPFLLIRLIPSLKPPRSALHWEWIGLLTLSFWALLAVRNAIGNGQLSVFTFFWMLVALHLNKQGRRIPTGIALALTLIKFSVGTPLLVYLLIKRRWSALTTALILHGAGLALYSLMINTPIPRLIEQGVNILFLLRLDYDIRVVNLAALMPAGEGFVLLAALIVTIPTGVVLARHWAAIQRTPDTAQPLVDLCLFALLTLTFTLMLYHNYYDSLIIGGFLALLVGLILRPSEASLSRAHIRWLGIFGALCVILMSVPGAALVNFLPRTWVSLWLDVITTSGAVLLTLAWGVCLWLLGRLAQAAPSAN